MSFQTKSKHERGQGLVEYAIILALVAVAVIAAMRILGPKVGNTFSTIDTAMSGPAVDTTVYHDWGAAVDAYCAANGLPHGTQVQAWLTAGGFTTYDPGNGATKMSELPCIVN